MYGSITLFVLGSVNSDHRREVPRESLQYSSLASQAQEDSSRLWRERARVHFSSSTESRARKENMASGHPSGKGVNLEEDNEEEEERTEEEEEEEEGEEKEEEEEDWEVEEEEEKGESTSMRRSQSRDTILASLYESFLKELGNAPLQPKYGERARTDRTHEAGRHTNRGGRREGKTARGGEHPSGQQLRGTGMRWRKSHHVSCLKGYTCPSACTCHDISACTLACHYNDACRMANNGFMMVYVFPSHYIFMWHLHLEYSVKL